MTSSKSVAAAIGGPSLLTSHGRVLSLVDGMVALERAAQQA